MPRTHGYAQCGQRCYGKHDWGAKGRTNVIGALLGGILLTVSMFESTINTDVYTAWVKQDLLPKLPPQSIVVMDNATFHKGNEMKPCSKLKRNALECLLIRQAQKGVANERIQTIKA